MTQNIRQAIVDTMEHSKQMVDIAQDSNVGIQENIRIMDALKSMQKRLQVTMSRRGWSWFCSSSRADKRCHYIDAYDD